MDLETRHQRTEAALVAAENGDFDTAMEFVIDLVSDDPSSAQAQRTWGRVLRARGQHADAVAAFRAAAMLDPTDAGLRFELASALLSEAELAEFMQVPIWLEARSVAIEGLELAPDNAMGRALLELIERQRDDIIL